MSPPRKNYFAQKHFKFGKNNNASQVEVDKDMSDDSENSDNENQSHDEMSGANENSDSENQGHDEMSEDSENSDNEKYTSQIAHHIKHCKSKIKFRAPFFTTDIDGAIHCDEDFLLAQTFINLPEEYPEFFGNDDPEALSTLFQDLEIQTHNSINNQLIDACSTQNIFIKKLSSLIEEGADINYRDKNGDTPLILLSRANSLAGVNVLLTAGANPILSNHENDSPFTIACRQKNKKMIKKIILACSQHFHWIEATENEPDEMIIYKLITTLIYKSNRHAWDSPPCSTLREYICALNKKYKKFQRNDFLTTLEKAETAQKTFFGSYLSDDSDSDEEKIFNNKNQNEKNSILKKATALTHRAQISTLTYQKNSGNQKKGDLKLNPFDASSLYKFSDRIQIIRDTNYRQNEEHIKNDLEKLNSLVLKNLSPEEFAKEFEKIQTVFAVAQYRGITYLTTKWNQKNRKTHRNEPEIDLPIYSNSVYQAAGIQSFAELQEKKLEIANFEMVCKKIADLVKHILLNFRETTCYTYQGYAFNHLADLLQQAYTLNYDGFPKLIESNADLKNLLLNYAIPFISTGDIPYHALKYAFGIKPYKGHEHERLRPRWQANGRAERPYSGKVYLSIHPITDYLFQDSPLNLVMLIWQARVQIDNLTIAERETAFSGYLPEKRIKYHFKAKYPSFKKEYKEIYLYKYGITKELFLKFKKALNDHAPHTEKHKIFKKMLGEWLCSYHEVCLIQKAQEIAKSKHNAILIYRDKNGLFSLNPPTDSPTRKGVSKKLKMPAMKKRSLRTKISPAKSKVIRSLSFFDSLDDIDSESANGYLKNYKNKALKSTKSLPQQIIESAWINDHVDVIQHLLTKPDFIPLFNAKIKEEEGVFYLDRFEFCHFLHLAIFENKIELVKAFINCKEIDINCKAEDSIDDYPPDDVFFYENLTPLHYAIILNNFEMVNALLNCPRVDKYATACRVDNKHLIHESHNDSMLDYEENVEIKKIDITQDAGHLGWAYFRDDVIDIHRTKALSALHLAAVFADVEIINALLEIGLDIDAKDSDDITPKQLLKKHKKIYSPLSLAFGQHEQAIKMLNDMDYDDITPELAEKIKINRSKAFSQSEYGLFSSPTVNSSSSSATPMKSITPFRKD